MAANLRPWLFVAIAGLTLSCSVVESSITSTPRPASTTVSHAAYSEWPLVLKDDFTEPDNDWETGQSNDRFSTGTVSIKGGKYRFDLKANDGFIWWSRSLDNTSTTDFYAAVDAQQITGPASADYGLVFRWERGNFYYFEISESGQFALSLYYFEKWETLVSWTSASAIRPGEVNRLAVGAEGSHFTFYVNGAFVGEADDSRLPGGSVGVAVELSQAGDQAVFQFDHFEWRAPSKAVSILTPTPKP